jgi:hypothetical protein
MIISHACTITSLRDRVDSGDVSVLEVNQVDLGWCNNIGLQKTPNTSVDAYGPVLAQGYDGNTVDMGESVRITSQVMSSEQFCC